MQQPRDFDDSEFATKYDGAPLDESKQIKDVQSFEELFLVMDAKKVIVGSRGILYSSAALKSSIRSLAELIKTGLVPLQGQIAMTLLDGITKAEGLRDKVTDLITKLSENLKKT